MVIMDKLDKLSFCKGLRPEYQQRLLSLGQFKTYPPGECLFREGQSCGFVYLLAQGQVALETSVPGAGDTCLQVVEAGDLIGWSPVLGLGVMSATARALTPCRALEIDAARVLALAEEEPRFVLEFLRRTAVTLARRLHATRRQLVEAYSYEGQQVS